MRLTFGAFGRRLLDLDLSGGWLDLDLLPALSSPEPVAPEQRGVSFLAAGELADPVPTVLFGFRAHDPEEGVPWPG